jgi:flavodoxin
MKALVIYDSLYGNTQKIALAIADTLGTPQDVTALRVGDVKPDHFAGLDLLIVGSPTQKFRPTATISSLLKGIPNHSLKGIKVAAFDTRLTWNEIEKTAVLAFFVKIYGYAAKPIADRLAKKGGEPVIAPQGFYVDGMEGPLLDGEMDRAVNWARQIITAISS